MSCPTTSLVPISKEYALAAARAMRAEIPERIAREKADTIEEILTKERRWQWRWPFRRRVTLDEARAMVEVVTLDWCGFPRGYGLWRLAGHDLKLSAHRLEVAAELTQDGQIWLNLDEAVKVKAWL